MIALHHGGGSGHSASVLIALAEKGLAYEDTRIDLGRFAQHEPDFLAINPAGQVPVLREDGRTLTEAFFILLYLDERYPDPPLGGADARARYSAQKWGKYVETHIAPNLATIAWAATGAMLGADAEAGLERLPPERRALWHKAASGFDDEEVAAAHAALVKAADRVAEDLAAGPWLGGKDYSLADIIAFPPLAKFAALGIELPAAVADWLARVGARPAVRDALGQGGFDGSVATMGPECGRWG